MADYSRRCPPGCVYNLRATPHAKFDLLNPANHDTAAISQMIDAGIAAEAHGDVVSAERLYRQAIEVDPGSALAHMNLGIVLHGVGDPSGAADEHAIAVKLDPGSAYAHYNLALALLELDDFSSAERSFGNAVRLRPEFPEGWVGLADALESLGRAHEALDALQSAIGQRPDYAGAIFNAGILLRKLGRLDEAAARLRQVPEDHPDSANAMTALAATLRDQGRIDEAIEVMRAALERMPDSGVAQCELLFTLGFSDQLSAEALFAEHLWAGCRAEYEVKPWCSNFPNSKDPERSLRVGYLSGDFRGHSVALFTEFLFERHRKDNVHAYAYSSTAAHDATTRRVMAAAHAWRDVKGQTDAVVARVILDDEIDILVDLAGHTGFQRIGVLAGRAAPIQMTWLGYINTTGLTRVDYRITDSVADPPGLTEALHTERLLRMPNAQWCFRPPEAVRQLPVSREVLPAAFTFGSFNQFSKVSCSTIALWISVLRSSPAARLRVIGVPRGVAAETLAGTLSAAGIDRSRVDLVERVSLGEYYSQYQRVDACLDTTPYSGGTTTCDALWMGVPVVTLAGERSMSRSAASLLTLAGYPELVARSPGEFATIATGLAVRGDWPTTERRILRERFAASPLMAEQAFTNDLESLFRGAWREWCGTRGS